MNNFLSPRMMVGAAIVGLVGAAGVFIYEQIYNEKRRTMLTSAATSKSGASNRGPRPRPPETPWTRV
ncbi:hypothetical protein MSG28_015370 [Choristoneura fumiferana]|uniref:Uncharacterized protein n=1 Tax=Choristoneura fumiferana TaxID=7141 RepID=A0ACC0KAU3_CHOFU|nr:hypothetical protein MSG28_015370 [Choristoneura fumiferana]